MSGSDHALKPHALGPHYDWRFPAAAGQRVSGAPQDVLVKKKLLAE